MPGSALRVGDAGLRLGRPELLHDPAAHVGRLVVMLLRRSVGNDGVVQGGGTDVSLPTTAILSAAVSTVMLMKPP
jgi:hypothetical protein